MKLGLAIALGAATLVLAAYANSLNSPFHFDDFHSVEDNVWLKSLEHLPRYFTDTAVFSPLEENRAYRPVLLISFAISHALGGGALWGYHLVTMLLHALGAWVIGLLVRRFLLAGGASPAASGLGAALAAAVFAVHPLLSEPVNYISSRSSLQAAVLSFAAVLAYVKGREERRRSWLVVAPLLLLLAMATKIIAMTVPVLLIAWEVLLGPSRRALRADAPRTWLVRLGPVVAVALGFTVFHELIVGVASKAGRSNIPPWSFFLTQTQVWLHYLGLFFWPEELNADRTMPWAQVIWQGPVARAILLNGAIVAVALSWWRRLPLVTFGVLWYYVTLAPTNSIMPLSEPASEHRVYIAVPGIVFTLWGLAFARKEVSRRALVAVATAGVLLVAALGVRTFYRNRVWQTDLALWGDVVARSPDNGRAHLNYGLAQMSRGDLAGARRSFDRCIETWPGYSFCWINRAALALHEKRYQDADHEIGRAEQLAPNNVYVNLWRGEIDRARERWESAAAAYQRTLDIAPGHLGARRGLAISLFMLGELDRARPMLEALDREDQLDADGHYALGYFADTAGERATAITRYKTALSKNPNLARARYNLALALQLDGKLEQAIVEYRYLAQSPSVTPDTLYNLSLALWQRGDHDGARAMRDRLRQVAPQYPGLAQLTF